jgi:hypothetical protein
MRTKARPIKKSNIAADSFRKVIGNYFLKAEEPGAEKGHA